MSDGVVIQGNNIDVLKTFPDNSVDSIVTDPPYGLSFMGKKWDYDVPTIELWTEVRRVLKPGGHLLSFGGTRTYHRLVIAIEDAGFEIRDQIQWIYGSGFPKSLNVGKQVPEFQGFGTALKPANEPIVLARKPLSEKTVTKNVLRWNCGALNIDASRIGTEVIAQHQRDLSQAHGNNWAAGTKQPVLGKTNYTVGRWPANVLFDESAAAMLDEQVAVSMPGMHVAGNKKLGNARKTDDSIFGMGSNDGPVTLFDGADTKPLASRFFYVAKASKRERNTGLEGMPEKSGGTLAQDKWSQENFGNSGTGRMRANHHPTVKPIRLMEYLCKLITPPGGTILDPFCGSGSTGVAAVGLGFSFIGIELEKEYCEIAEKRINNVSSTSDKEAI